MVDDGLHEDSSGNHKDRFPCLMHAKDIQDLKSRTTRLESGMLEVLAESSASRNAAEGAKVEAKATKEIATKVFNSIGEFRGDFREYQKQQRQSCSTIHDGVSERLKSLEAKDPDDIGSGIRYVDEPELLAAKYDVKSKALDELKERLSGMEGVVRSLEDDREDAKAAAIQAKEDARSAEEQARADRRAAAEARNAADALMLTTQSQLKTARYGMWGAIATAIIVGVFGVVQALYGG